MISIQLIDLEQKVKYLQGKCDTVLFDGTNLNNFAARI